MELIAEPTRLLARMIFVSVSFITIGHTIPATDSASADFAEVATHAVFQARHAILPVAAMQLVLPRVAVASILTMEIVLTNVSAM